MIGGATIFLASLPGGDTHVTNRKIREEIIQNEFFTRLIASGATTLEELRKVETFAAYGDGYVGLSEEVWTWDEAKLLARRTGGKILDFALTPQESRKEMGTWLAKNFPAAPGRASWIQDQSEAKGIDAPDLLNSTDPGSRWRVFLHWSESSGWKNQGWSWTIEPRFDEARPFTEWDLAAVRVGTRWGVLKESGEFALEPQFDEIGEFSDKGCARVLLGDQWGVVNRRGQLVAKPEWEDVQDQIQGFTPVKRGGKWGYLDESGALAIPCEWDDAWRFSPEGFAVVTREGKRGILDRTGKVVIPVEWDGAINFSKEGLGMVRRGEGWSLVDTTGRELTPAILKARWSDRRWDLGFLPHEDGSVARDGSAILGERATRLIAFVEPEERFSDGLARIDTETGSGFVDTFGEWAIAPTEYFCREFHEGFAAASKDGKWGFIDRSGAVVVAPAWDEVGDFAEGRAAVKRGGYWGWIAGDGRVISDMVWDEVRPFREGFSAVRREAKWGFMDRNGKVIAQPAWQEVGEFSEGFASVRIEPTPEQLAMVAQHRLGNVVFVAFIDQKGQLTFEGQSWPYEEYRSHKKGLPAFLDGYCWVSSLKENPRNSRSYLSYVFIDTLGREEFVIPKVLAPNLMLQEEPRTGNYVNRNGDTDYSHTIVTTDGIVMPGVNRRSDNLADFVPYATPPKYGLIDLTGNVIVTPTWEEVKILSPDRVWIKVDGKCGLANGRGQILIEPKWEELEVLEVDTGSLAEDGTTILLGQSGKPILSPWVRVRDQKTTSYLRDGGSPAIPDSMPNATFVDFYDRERIVIREPVAEGGELLSIFHPATGGKRTFPAAAKLRWNWNTANLGFVWMQSKETLRWYLRGRNGEDYGHSQPEPEKPEGWGFIEGRARLHVEGDWFHIATDGKAISAERWEEANDFSEGRAAVKRAGKWGYVGLDGAIVTEPIYDEVLDFSEGLAAVKIEERWGFIDPAGTMVIAPVWDEAQSFARWHGEAEDGSADTPYLEVAEVKINGAAAMIGRDGSLIIDPRLPRLSKDGSAYGNGTGQWIVMKVGGSVTVVPRQWKANDQSWRPYLETSPARRWEPNGGSDAWSLIDETGKVLSEGEWARPSYDVKTDPFSEKLISARNAEGKYGLVRRDGSLVTEARFDRIAWIAPGIAATWNRDEGGLMRSDGSWIFQDNEEVRIARFAPGGIPRTAPQFRHGLAAIEDVPQWGYARLNRSAPTTP